MTRNRVHVAFFLVAALLFSAVTPAIVAGQNDVTLTVTVVDQNGDPVSGVDLSATWDGGGPVNETTRSNGQALVDVPEGSNVTITVHDDDYVRNSPFELEDASTGEVKIPVSMAGSATIEVVGEDGPVDGAVVQIRRDGEFVVNGHTDSDGTLRTRDIEQGDYRVRVWTRGYLRNDTALAVDGDVTREVRIRQGSRLLQVAVRDDHFSPPRPVKDAEVTVENRGTITTLSNGQATLQVPVNTKYEVSVTKDGYESNSTSVQVREAEMSANLTIQRTDAIDLEPGNNRVVVGEKVRVTVTDEYGDPVANADVSLEGESAGQTDDEGVASILIERAGTNNITATSGDLEANATVEGISADGDEPTETDTESTTSAEDVTTTTDGSGPGFTVLSAFAAFVAMGLLYRRR